MGAWAQSQAQDSTPGDRWVVPGQHPLHERMTALDKVDMYINGDESDQRVVEGLRIRHHF